MKITHDEIRHVARLARIEIPEEQFDKLAQDMESIVDMVAQLQQVDLSGLSVNLGRAEQHLSGRRAHTPRCRGRRCCRMRPRGRPAACWCPA